MIALDVLRGMTIGGMILVNSPGTWEHVFPPLCHSAWNGMTFADLIFPLFLFMTGVSMYISLQKYHFTLTPPLLLKILRRSALIFLVGMGIYALAPLGHIRILGVLQRIALCYGCGAVWVCCVRHSRLPWIVAVLLLGYCGLLLWGNGFEYGTGNILSFVDRQLLGIDHKYFDHGIDPEGVLSTLPCIAHVLIGFCMGSICLSQASTERRLNQLYLYGVLLLLAGWLLQDICPLNKKVWSPTFVLATCGCSTLLLSVLIGCIDATQRFRTVWPFQVLGANSLFCYVLSEVLFILLDALSFQGTSLHAWVYNGISTVCGDNAFSSLVFALLFTGAIWLVGYLLYQRKIFIKL